MNPLALLNSRVKAAEGSFFKPEQEEAILARQALLKAEGRFDKVSPGGITGKNAGDVLPEILSHQMPLNVAGRAAQRYNNSKGYTVVQPRTGLTDAISDFNRANIYDDVMLGGAAKFRRDMWKGSSHEGTSIFAISDAQKVMLEGAEKLKSAQKKAKLIHVGPKLEPQPVMKVMGVPLKLLPEPTPGRALLWGTLLAVWTGSALASYTCSTLGIEAGTDVRPKLKEALEPLRSYFSSSAVDMREKMLAGELAMDTSSMSHKLKESLKVG